MSELKFHEYSDSKNPKYLVIFLHGYGANGANLLNLAQEFAKTLPDAHFISPNGIEPWEGGFPDCYQWFSLSNGFERKALEEMSDNIKSASETLKNFIDQQLARFNLDYDNLFLVGFSQGAMMANYQGMAYEKTPKGIISFSGKVIAPEFIGEETISKPKICLIHGEADSVVTIDHFEAAQEILEENEMEFEAHSLNNLEHSINLRGVNLAQNFIKKLL